MKRVFLTAAMLSVLVSAPMAASAVTAPSTVRHVSYVIAYEPLFGTHMPYVGWLQLTVSGGIINGRYRGLSITPDDPFVDRITPVSGGISGNNIHFDVGTGAAPLSFNGRISGQWISGTAEWRGQLYRLTGEIGRPHRM